MKKLFLIIGLLIPLGFAITRTVSPGFSAGEVPYPQPTDCRQSWVNYQDALGRGFDEQLNLILDQPAPASELIDDAFEAYRTYRCQLEYTCRAVLYSTTADPAATANTGLTTTGVIIKKPILGKIPGCVSASDIALPAQWQEAWDAIKTSAGSGFIYTPPAGVYTHIPQCRVTSGDAVSAAGKQYNDCLGWVYDNTCQPDDTAEDCKKKSIGLIKVEKALTQNASEKRSRALEEKLLEILNKLNGMEGRSVQLKQLFQKLDQLVPCSINVCT